MTSNISVGDITPIYFVPCLSIPFFVTGNEKLRLNYDREIFRHNSSAYASANSRMDYNDDFEKKYYERTSKMKSRRGYGKTAYYDFDAWYKAHYVDFPADKYYTGHHNSYTYRTTVKPEMNNLKPTFTPYPLYLFIGCCLLIYSYNVIQKKK